MSRCKNHVLENADGRRLEVYNYEDRKRKEYYQEVTFFVYLPTFNGYDPKTVGVESFSRFFKKQAALVAEAFMAVHNPLVTPGTVVNLEVTPNGDEALFTGEAGPTGKEFRAWVSVRLFFKKPSDFLAPGSYMTLIDKDRFAALAIQVLKDYETYYTAFAWKLLVASQVNDLFPWVKDTVHEAVEKKIGYAERAKALMDEYEDKYTRTLDKLLAEWVLEAEVVKAEGDDPTAWEKQAFVEIRKRRDQLLRRQPPGHFQVRGINVNAEEIDVPLV